MSSMSLTREELKEFLDEKVEQYNRPSFIELDQAVRFVNRTFN